MAVKACEITSNTIHPHHILNSFAIALASFIVACVGLLTVELATEPS